MPVVLVGFDSNALNSSRVTINVQAGYLNLAKGFGFNIDPNNQSSDGYPVTTPSGGTYGSNAAFPPANYFGSFVWKWTGTGAMQWTGGPPMVVTSGGLDIFELNSASGDLAAGNHSIVTQNLAVGATNPKIVFSVGWNIQSISNNAGLIRVGVKTGFLTGSGVTGTIVTITGANSNTGANGVWTITVIDAQTFDLQASTFTNAQVSPAGVATYSPGGLTTITMLSGFGTSFSDMSNLVICRSADETAISNGLITDAVLVSQLQQLMGTPARVGRGKPGWLRFMDLIGVQSNFEGDFSQRIPSTYLSYNSISFRPGYWTPSASGAITNGGSDAYTCTDPSVSVWSGSAYIDNAIVQGITSATNSAGMPTLNVGGHGAKPIFSYADGIPPFIIALSAGAPTPGTDVLQITFTANSWTSPPLNGGAPYVFSYNTTVSGPFGSDAVLANLNANLAAALVADTTLAAANIFTINPENGIGPFILPRTAQQQRLALTYTSGPAIVSIQTMRISSLAAGGATFVYNSLLDGWIYRQGGMVTSIPLEAIADMCNQVGANCWWCWGTTKSAWVTAVTQFFGDSTTGLTSGLRFGNEPWNEVWNSLANPFAALQTLGASLGWGPPSLQGVYSYVGLRMIQYATLAKSAWTGKGRSASDYYVLQPSATFDVATNSNFDTAQLKGTSLTTSNNTYATYGGLNGGSSPSYTAVGSRPVDITTATGCAPYWNSHWWGAGSFTNASTVTGTASENSPWLQAALDYANGLTSTAFSSLVNQFNGTTVRSSGSNFGTNLLDYQNFVFSPEEALCAQYDASRGGLLPLGIMDYEGGPAFGIGQDGNNGVNSVNSTDITALANQMTSLGWNVSTWTSSGTDNKTEMATMMFTMSQAWKNDASYKNFIKTSYYTARKTISSGREVHPGQYGYSGSNWGLFPVNYLAGNQYTNYSAISEFDA